jgi:hypothetical protein
MTEICNALPAKEYGDIDLHISKLAVLTIHMVNNVNNLVDRLKHGVHDLFSQRVYHTTGERGPGSSDLQVLRNSGASHRDI